jgi:hypothetical protein
MGLPVQVGVNLVGEGVVTTPITTTDVERTIVEIILLMGFDLNAQLATKVTGEGCDNRGSLGKPVGRFLWAVRELWL